MKLTTFAMMASVALSVGAAFAADTGNDGKKTQTVTLRSGKVLQDAYILDKKPNGITLAFKDGCMFIPFSDMPLEYQQKFGYDAIKSARYENKLKEQRKIREIEEAARKGKETKRKADEDKHYKDRRISAQQQTVRKLELQLEEAKKRLDTAEKDIDQDRSTLGMSSIGSKQVCIESPWGYGERIRSGELNSAVRNKLMKEVDTLGGKRDNLAQNVIDLQLKLEAAQRTLDALLEKQ
ncbi:MAG: hypothetical protein IKQ16_07925 [Lentisphaeria bacterium]|nr:hypothetical protein [Lentisphaeria bacterium]